MTWMASPFFNLLLRLNRFGRLALSREQTVASNWLGLCLLVALLGLAGAGWRSARDLSLMTAFVFGFLMIPVSMVYRCPAGGARWTMAGAAICLALAGVAAILIQVLADHRIGPGRGASDTLFAIVLLGALLSTWLVNILRSQGPRRK
jgi:DMSO reductase anchor subunit